MELQARVRVWGRPRGRSGCIENHVSLLHIAREDARVGAGSENYVKFRKSFNTWVKAGPAEGETEPRGTKIGDYGRLQPDIWGAVFDLYEYDLKAELGEDASGVATLRQKLTWVDDSRKSLGFSEHHPVDANRPDGMRSQEDRRVEVLMFDQGEEPDLAAAEGDPEGAVLYDGVTYERKPVEPMLSAKRWRAYWEDEETPAKEGTVRNLVLDAPGLTAGVPLAFEVYQAIEGGSEQVTATVAATSKDGSATAPFDEWYNRDLVQRVESGPLPKVDFRFVVEVSGRRAKSASLAYRDSLNLTFVHKDTGLPFADTDCRIHSPWGLLTGKTSVEGFVEVVEIPPGGMRVVLREYRLIQDA